MQNERFQTLFIEDLGRVRGGVGGVGTAMDGEGGSCFPGGGGASTLAVGEEGGSSTDMLGEEGGGGGWGTMMNGEDGGGR